MPPGWSGFVNALNISWMCGMLTSSTVNGHVIPRLSPIQR